MTMMDLLLGSNLALMKVPLMVAKKGVLMVTCLVSLSAMTMGLLLATQMAEMLAIQMDPVSEQCLVLCWGPKSV